MRHARAPSVGARELLAIRWIVGIMGAAMLLFVVADMRDGTVSWATWEHSARTDQPNQRGHFAVDGAAGLACAFLALGLPSLAAVAAAVEPRLFGQRYVVVVVALALLGAVGLGLLRRAA